jgi:hypothetical protein
MRTIMAAGKRSFGAVVWKRFQDTIHNAVSEYVEENFENLGLRSYRIHNPTEAYFIQ